MKRTKKVYIDPLISCYPWAVKLNALLMAQKGYEKAVRTGASGKREREKGRKRRTFQFWACRCEKSFPVMLTTFTCIHKETKEKIKYDDYKNLSDEEKAQYNLLS